MTWVKNVGFWLSIHSTERLFPPQEKPIVLTSTFLPTPQSKTGKTQGRVTRELCALTSGAFNDLSISRSEIHHLVFSFLPLSCSFFLQMKCNTIMNGEVTSSLHYRPACKPRNKQKRWFPGWASPATAEEERCRSGTPDERCAECGWASYTGPGSELEKRLSALPPPTS